MLLLYFVALGVLVGRLSGGRLAALETVHFRWWGIALGGLAFQLLLFSDPVAERVGGAGPILYVLSSIAVVVALLPNLRQPGFALIGLGAMLNLAAITANGGFMPSDPAAWVALDGAGILPTAAYTNSALIHSGTLLPFLGDVFVLPRPLPFANVFSLGDLLIGVGATWFLIRTMHRPAPAGSDPVDLATGSGNPLGPIAAPR